VRSLRGKAEKEKKKLSLGYQRHSDEQTEPHDEGGRLRARREEKGARLEKVLTIRLYAERNTKIGNKNKTRTSLKW